MKQIFLVPLLCLLLLQFSGAVFAASEDSESSQDLVKFAIKERKGLKFDVPEDWPIEQRGGIMAPIPENEYIALKMKEIDEKLKAFSAQLQDIDDRVVKIEKKETRPVPVLRTEEKI